MTSRLSLRGMNAFLERCRELEDIQTPIRRALGTHVPGTAPRIWNEGEALAGARTRMDRAALAGARVRASDRSVTITGATSPRIMRGDWAAVEFGDGSKTFETYRRRSPNGGTHEVRRRTQNQLPDRRRKGRVLYPAGQRAVRRFASLISSTIVRTIHDTLEGR